MSSTLYLPSHRIRSAVVRIARRIRDELPLDAKHEGLWLLSVLVGGVRYGLDLANLLTEMEVCPLRIGMVGKFGDTIYFSGDKHDLEGANVLLADDICETGKTLNHVGTCLKKVGVKQVWTTTLIDRLERRRDIVAELDTAMDVRYHADEFVDFPAISLLGEEERKAGRLFGYGMDDSDGLNRERNDLWH